MATELEQEGAGPSPEAATVQAEVRAWLETNWDPELTLAEWWERLTDSGWSAPTWPKEWYGRGLTSDLAKIVTAERERIGAPGGPGGLGVMLAGPTIITHGSDEQKRRYLRPMLTGQEAWCQLFSEPGAGSDLAALQCKAERDGDEWVVAGQKVWSSGAHFADLGMLLARTDPDVPKHAGITYFVISMDQPGIEIRPIKEMTGRALFNEVFLDGARVQPGSEIGGLNNGWGVALTTLANERSGLGGGSDAAGGLPARGFGSHRDGRGVRRPGEQARPQARPPVGPGRRPRDPPGHRQALHARGDQPLHRHAGQGGRPVRAPAGRRGLDAEAEHVPHHPRGAGRRDGRVGRQRNDHG